MALKNNSVKIKIARILKFSNDRLLFWRDILSRQSLKVDLIKNSEPFDWVSKNSLWLVRITEYTER